MPPVVVRGAVCGAAALLVLAGCAGSKSPSAKVPAPAPAASSPTPSATSGQTAVTNNCAGVVAATTSALASYPDVGVADSDECRSLDITTKLTKADVATAQKICEAASTIGYAGSILNVNVNGVNGVKNVELSISVKGARCIGEP